MPNHQQLMSSLETTQINSIAELRSKIAKHTNLSLERIQTDGLMAIIDSEVVNIPTSVIHRLADHNQHLLHKVTNPLCEDCLAKTG